MFNELTAVAVSAFQGEKKTDKNGAQNVWLTPIAGKIPNIAMVVAGTVAEQAGLTIGKTLLVMTNEGAEREVEGVMRRQFNHTVLGEVKPMEIIGVRKELGKAEVLVIEAGAAPDAENTTATGGGANLNTSGLGLPKTEAVTEPAV